MLTAARVALPSEGSPVESMLTLLLLALGTGGLAEDEAAASRGCWAPRLPLRRLLLLPLLSGSCATLLSLLLLLLLLGSAYEEAPPLPEEKLDDEAREHLRVVLAIDASSSGVEGWPGGAAAAKAALTAARVQETSHRPCSSSSSSDEWSRPSSTASSARACRTFSAKDSLRDMMPEDADHSESSSCMGLEGGASRRITGRFEECKKKGKLRTGQYALCVRVVLNSNAFYSMGPTLPSAPHPTRKASGLQALLGHSARARASTL